MGSQPPKPLRIAILECDTPQPKTKSKYTSYGGVFTALLSAATSPSSLSDSSISLSTHDVVNVLDSYPKIEEVDALLLTGSRHTAFENDEWILKLVEYVKSALEKGIKVIGICFGHQIVGRAVGVKVGKSDKGWEVAVTDVELTPKGKEIFGLEKMRIHQMHRDIVYSFPPDSHPLGSNDVCEVQGMYSPGKYITVQGHPEFTEDIISAILVNRHKQGIFVDEVYEGGMSRAAAEHDGVAIAKAFLNFARNG